MKKLLVFGFIGLMVVSCKPTMDTKSQLGLKGNWTLTSITHIGGEYVKVNSFNIADAHCFEGSQWKFVSNNNSGSLSLNKGGDCPHFESSFKWTVTPNSDFEFKFIDEGVKAKHVTTGYKMKVKNQSANSFELVDKFYAGGQSYDVTYHFERN
ncbi:lipocalin family protein [Myroides indicus]|uniref:Lipocalin-like protein n=1 Tax=Myroides indicus TaxID=1323422 RepID=A0A4R7EV33_9FLAO|nr:lipocalin family protein [Myroides indicus]TDS57539.1 lipocalin-like protein [Myroides indicus]